MDVLFALGWLEWAVVGPRTAFTSCLSLSLTSDIKIKSFKPGFLYFFSPNSAFLALFPHIFSPAAIFPLLIVGFLTTLRFYLTGLLACSTIDWCDFYCASVRWDCLPPGKWDIQMPHSASAIALSQDIFFINGLSILLWKLYMCVICSSGFSPSWALLLLGTEVILKSKCLFFTLKLTVSQWFRARWEAGLRWAIGFYLIRKFTVDIF